MSGFVKLSLLAGAAALALLWLVSPTPVIVQATPPGPLDDTDGDFLPDQVEWAVMTSSTSADTDGDAVPDFVEVVQRGLPRTPNGPVGMDHEMRVVVSSPPAGAADQAAWLHVLVRFAETAVPIDNFAIWFETPWLPGLHIPLDGLLMIAPQIDMRVTPVDGVWLRVSAPLVSLSLLHALLPCSIQAEGFVGGRHLRTGANLFEMQGEIATIVPFGNDAFAVQTITAMPPTGCEANKVCVLDLTEVGSGPGGTVFEVTDATCEDCNELECGLGCTGAIGWLLTIPGGTAAMTNF